MASPPKLHCSCSLCTKEWSMWVPHSASCICFELPHSSSLFPLPSCSVSGVCCTALQSSGYLSDLNRA